MRYIVQTGVERYLLEWQSSAYANDTIKTGVKQDIWLDPLDSDVLFGASNPRVFETAAIARKRKPRLQLNDEFRLEHGSTLHYTVWSDLQTPPPDELRQPVGSAPGGYAVYLQLPAEITEETYALARRLTDGLPTDYDKAVAIERWLESNLSYTLELRDPGRTEPVHFFLFDRKKGHCEYFASAFVILARSVGVPARNVNGFLGGEWNEYDDYIAVRAGDAHSWAEVYFPGEGWVTFDPTPAGEADPLGRGGSGVVDRMRRMFDTVRFQWSKWVVDYDLHQQISLFRDVGSAISSAGRWLKAGAGATKRWLLDHWPWATLAAVLAVALLLARRRRRRPQPRHDDDEPRRQRRRKSAMASLYASVLARLARHGLARSPATTPRELAADLVARGAPGAAELAELTELYYAAEWGGAASPEVLERAQRLRRAIEAAVDARGDEWAKAGPAASTAGPS